MIAGLNVDHSVIYLACYTGCPPLQFHTFHHIEELTKFVKRNDVKMVGIILKPHDGKKMNDYDTDNGIAVLIEMSLDIPLYRMNYGDTARWHGLTGKRPNVIRNKIRGFVMRHSDFGSSNHNNCPLHRGGVAAGFAAVTTWLCHGKDILQ